MSQKHLQPGLLQQQTLCFFRRKGDRNANHAIKYPEFAQHTPERFALAKHPHIRLMEAEQLERTQTNRSGDGADLNRRQLRTIRFLVGREEVEDVVFAGIYAGLKR